MKREGYALVECMIGLTILVVIITFIGKSQVLDIMMKTEKVKIVKTNNIIDFIDKEIKYNMTFDELKQILGEGELRIENSLDILEEIKVKDITNLKEGEGIEIRKVDEGENYIDYNIEVDGVVAYLTKSRWMDETS